MEEQACAPFRRLLDRCERQGNASCTRAHACPEHGRPKYLWQASKASEEDVGQEGALDKKGPTAQEDGQADAEIAQEISEFVAWGLPEGPRHW